MSEENIIHAGETSVGDHIGYRLVPGSGVVIDTDVKKAGYGRLVQVRDDATGEIRDFYPYAVFNRLEPANDNHDPAALLQTVRQKGRGIETSLNEIEEAIWQNSLDDAENAAEDAARYISEIIAAIRTERGNRLLIAAGISWLRIGMEVGYKTSSFDISPEKLPRYRVTEFDGRFIFMETLDGSGSYRTTPEHLAWLDSEDHS